jgi:nitronate monooxygenase
MPLPVQFEGRLKLPAIAAPMFLTSGPDLVVEVCRSGLIGTFPALNQRTTQGYEAWLEEIESRLAGCDGAAPYGVNLVVHKSNPRLESDLEATVRRRVPLVITSLGAASQVVDAVHGYGGLVFHDVISRRHAQKAAAAGVDGLIAVCAGAGGHAGSISPFALVAEIADIFSGTIVLAGAISTGRDIAAARMMGADMAYLGTRFIATRESLASPEYKQMIAQAGTADIVYTSSISGVPANFLRPSIAAAGLDPDHIESHGRLDVASESLAWKTVWSAGQGACAVTDVPPAAELCRRLAREYHDALSAAHADPYAAPRAPAAPAG